VTLFSDDSLGDSAADHRLFSLGRIIGHVSIFLGREKKAFWCQSDYLYNKVKEVNQTFELSFYLF